MVCRVWDLYIWPRNLTHAATPKIKPHQRLHIKLQCRWHPLQCHPNRGLLPKAVHSSVPGLPSLGILRSGFGLGVKLRQQRQGLQRWYALPLPQQAWPQLLRCSLAVQPIKSMRELGSLTVRSGPERRKHLWTMSSSVSLVGRPTSHLHGVSCWCSARGHLGASLFVLAFSRGLRRPSGRPWRSLTIVEDPPLSPQKDSAP